MGLKQLKVAFERVLMAERIRARQCYSPKDVQNPVITSHVGWLESLDGRELAQGVTQVSVYNRFEILDAFLKNSIDGDEPRGAIGQKDDRFIRKWG